ncbi:ribonuclease BN [Clostridium carboxidivorans P7]|uniref:Ribonuclease BN n=1 Tax=Clostridium carboxidivorans P7 TaxID=536227 RepID=C6Q124_9CLOT|nr:YihY/virulence factor BrkB family protein [Clostridium carboxidivorans]AKN32885.1 ribonuclease BN [Clostridium carboxidivorans P7]EET84818.1 ribonuclease BN [Clostridium carboxidivorans P7]EFG89868.1 YihY family protein [Clostridium carboxidivorans P7]
MGQQVVKDIKNLMFRFNEDDVLSLSSQLAYSLIFAFFPFLIFLMTVLGYSSINSQDVLAGLNRIIPRSALELIKNTIIEVVDYKNPHLMSFSLIFTIWSASSGFNGVIKGLNKAYDELEHRSFLKVQFIAVLCTIGLVIAIFTMIFLLVFGQIIGNSLALNLGFSEEFKIMWHIVRYIIIIVLTIFILAALYHYTPCRRLTWREVSSGAIFATIGLILVSIGFAFYVNNFGNYSKIYGSIGAVIILLTWLFLVSITVVMGGELNATLAFDREGKEKFHKNIS